MSTSKGWKKEQGRLRKELNFKSFEMAIAYIQVILELWTHDENAITDLDWKLAEAFDELDVNFE